MTNCQESLLGLSNFNDTIHSFKLDSNYSISEEKSEGKKSLDNSNSQPMTTTLNHSSLNETFNAGKLLAILVDFDKLKRSTIPTEHRGDEEYENKVYRTLTRLAYKCSNNEQLTHVKQQYKYAKGKHDGRLYGSLLQSLPKKLMHTLCLNKDDEQLYYELDMVNAGPVILQAICKEKGIDCPVLDSYVKNRRKIIKQVRRYYPLILPGTTTKYYNYTKREVKQEIISLMFGKAASKTNDHCDFIVDFYNERNDIVQELKILEPELYAKALKKKPENPLGSMLSTMIFKKEGEFLQYVHEITQQDGYETGIFCGDGCKIYNYKYTDNHDDEGTRVTQMSLQQIHKYELLIKEKFNVNMKLKIKKMKRGKKGIIDHVVENVKRFLYDLKTKREGEVVSIPLDDLKADECMCSVDIGRYDKRLDETDILIIRSPMKTMKTQNLKALFSNHERVVICSFRKSLDQAYLDEFKEYGFELYNSNPTYNQKRIIVQIDSLHKLRGECDLFILDEFVYTSSHLCSFVKKKKEVMDTLKEYIRSSRKVIAMDALMDNYMVEFFRDVCDRPIYIVDNTFHSFKGRKANIYDAQQSEAFILDAVQAAGTSGKKLFIATNSKKVGIKTMKKLNKEHPQVRCVLISADTKDCPVAEWVNYDVVIITPTVVAGISQNVLHFDEVYAYFTSESCGAEMAAQMLFRARNLSTPNMNIYIKQGFNYISSSKQAVEERIKDNDGLHENIGLKIKRTTSELIKNSYYKLYVNSKRRENRSKNNYEAVLRGILEHHGVEVENVHVERDVQVLKAEAKKSASNLKSYQLEIAQQVVESNDISKEVYTRLNESNNITCDQTLECDKYRFKRNCGPNTELTKENLVLFEPKYDQIRNLNALNVDRDVDDINMCIQDEFTRIETKRYQEQDSTEERLHQSNDLLRLYGVNYYIQRVAGFKDVWDKTIKPRHSHDLDKQFLVSYGNKLSVLYKKQPVDWSLKDTSNTKDRKHMSTYINDILSKTCGIKLKIVSNRGNMCAIDGLQVFEKHKVEFKPSYIRNTVLEYDGDTESFKSVLKPKVKTSRPVFKREYNVIINYNIEQIMCT